MVVFVIGRIDIGPVIRVMDCIPNVAPKFWNYETWVPLHNHIRNIGFVKLSLHKFKEAIGFDVEKGKILPFELRKMCPTCPDGCLRLSVMASRAFPYGHLAPCS